MELIFEKLPKKFLYIFLVTTVLIGIVLRTYKLDHFPLQINQDELSNIFDGYCIAETGSDRWGEKYPVILKGFGDLDNRPPLYSYLTALSVKLFGYSVVSGRLPSALIGCVSLLLLFLVGEKLGGKLYGFCCLLLATFSPWHLLFSRIAHEGASLPPFFMILTIFLTIKAKESGYKIWLLGLLGFTVGFSTNAYQATKVIFFLASLIIGLYIYLETNKNFKSLGIFILGLFLGALPQIIALLYFPERFFARANDQLIPFSFSIDFLKTIITNFLSNFDPHYLFLSFGDYNNLTIGRLLQVEILYFYLGLWFFYQMFSKNRTIDVKLIYAFLLISLLAVSITKDNPNSLRTSASILIFPLFTSASVLYIFQKLTQFNLGKLSVFIFIGLILANSAYNIKKYSKSMVLRGKGHQYGQVAMYQKMKQYDSSFEKVYIQHYGAFQYLFVASYCGIKPKEFHSLPKEYSKNGWYQFKSLGNYHFLSAEDIHLKNDTSKNGKNLIVLLEKTNRYTLIDSLNFLEEKIYYYKN